MFFLFAFTTVMASIIVGMFFGSTKAVLVFVLACLAFCICFLVWVLLCGFVFSVRDSIADNKAINARKEALIRGQPMGRNDDDGFEERM